MLKLNRIYCGYNDFEICKDINLNIKKGYFTSIIGPNGAGKTTLLKSIAGIVNYHGDITLDDINFKSINRKDFGQKVALLAQSSETYFSYSVYDTVMLGRYPYLQGFLGLPNKKDKAIVEHALDLVGFYNHKDCLINQLSGGQLQRVFLARTIAQQPDVVLLDEPTNHLDFKHQVEILDFVKDWAKKEQKIIIAVLHDLNLVQKYSDYVLLLHNGIAYANGYSKEVLTTNNLEDVYDIDVKNWMKKALSLWE